MKTLRFFIPWPAPMSPNRWRAQSTRLRMSMTRVEREKAYMVARKAAIEQHVQPFIGPAKILLRVHRRKLLDPLINLPASLKATQDGICKAVLPNGDGPRCGYAWSRITQVQVAEKVLEGVEVRIEEP